jgi:FkbM family methyltransferase
MGMREKGVEVDFFIDQYTSKTDVRGCPVYRISEVADKETVIYISIPSNPLDTAADTAIKANLEICGFRNLHDFVECLHLFPGILPALCDRDILWMRKDREKMINHAKIWDVHRLLSDDKSKQLLANVVTFRQTLSPDTYILPDFQEEYFPSDIDLFSDVDRLRFVDAGAYIGDTVNSAMSAFSAAGKEVEYILAFEPDLENVQKLVVEVKKQQVNFKDSRFYINACGLWSEPTVLSFASNGNSSSSITQSLQLAPPPSSPSHFQETLARATMVPVTTLDCSAIAASPNYIKMDIEGAEQQALLGAKDVIAKYHPILAICVYHKPADLWEIPLLIRRLFPGYKMYLRIHGHMGLSMVLYCVP